MTLTDTFKHLYSTPPTLYARAPGRVNLLGEHVDYNAGPVLPVAIDRAVSYAAAPNFVHPRQMQLFAVDLNQGASFDLDDLVSRRDLEGKPLPAWALYPAGVAWALQNAGYPLQGLQIAFTSNVPIGAGLSSSAAVEVGFAVLCRTAGIWQADALSLAQLCQKAENEYVGVACGLMDQFASACGVAGHALYLDTRSLFWEPARLPGGISIVIADSGIRRSLANSAYNERRESCEQAVEILRAFMPEIRSLRDVSPIEFMAYSDSLPAVVRKRAEHVVKEIARVESALNALQRQDSHVFGALMFACHTSLRDLYEVSTPELNALVEIAHTLPGSLGARLTGAGFGGCTVNLVETDQAEEFILGLCKAYLVRTGREAQAYLCQASQGAEGWVN